jgi:ComF family protein
VDRFYERRFGVKHFQIINTTQMALANTANLFYDSLLALVYPQPCAVCGDSVESRVGGVACEKCWQQTRLFSGMETLCWKCGLPSRGTVADERREDVRCRRCDDDAFTAARACGVYEGALRASVLNLKREQHIASRLKRLMIATQQQYPLCETTRIIPVPLHPEREKARGFNQAAFIARELAEARRLPLDEVSLVRTNHTNRHRAGMDWKGRRDTVANAFRVVYPALIAGERVLLIDDVFTTGATVSSCAKALLDAGAAEVFVLTLARPVRNE